MEPANGDQGASKSKDNVLSRKCEHTSASALRSKTNGSNKQPVASPTETTARKQANPVY